MACATGHGLPEMVIHRRHTQGWVVHRSFRALRWRSLPGPSSTDAQAHPSRRTSNLDQRDHQPGRSGHDGPGTRPRSDPLTCDGSPRCTQMAAGASWRLRHLPRPATILVATVGSTPGGRPGCRRQSRDRCFPARRVRRARRRHPCHHPGRQLRSRGPWPEICWRARASFPPTCTPRRRPHPSRRPTDHGRMHGLRPGRRRSECRGCPLLAVPCLQSTPNTPPPIGAAARRTTEPTVASHGVRRAPGGCPRHPVRPGTGVPEPSRTGTRPPYRPATGPRRGIPSDLDRCTL